MGKNRSHDRTAKHIARRYGTEYNARQGADVQTGAMVIEVETPETVLDAARQLRGYRKAVYIAGTNREAVGKALEAANGTTIGVMDSDGNIIRPSTRKT